MMRTVILIGNADRTAKAVTAALSRFAPTSVIGTRLQTVEHPKVLAVLSEKLCEVDTEGAVLVFTGRYKKTSGRLLSAGVAVADSSDRVAAELLSGTGIPVVTCGGEKDTLCFSSEGGGSFCITLQRSIRTLAGEVTEPCEIPVKSPFCDRFEALLCAGVLLLLGASPEEVSFGLNCTAPRFDR